MLTKCAGLAVCTDMADDIEEFYGKGDKGKRNNLLKLSKS